MVVGVKEPIHKQAASLADDLQDSGLILKPFLVCRFADYAPVNCLPVLNSFSTYQEYLYLAQLALTEKSFVFNLKYLHYGV
jgi:hypothetical protein